MQIPISVKVSGVQGTVLLCGIIDETLVVFGSSVPMSASPGDRVGCVTLVPRGQERGVIAIGLSPRDSKKSQGEWRYYLVEVGRKNGESFVNRDHPFECCCDRLAQIIDGSIEVQIGDDWYASRKSCRNRVFVPDANLLCRFIAGTATVDDVKAAAQKCEAEQTELEQLREQLKHSVPETVQFGLEGEIALLEEAKRGLEDNVKFWRGVAFALWGILRKFGPLFRGFGRTLCDSQRFKTAYAHQSAWHYSTDAFALKDDKDWMETPLVS